jgi:hypothetical protein
MKKGLLTVALACVMVFGFASTALADHSPQFYFDFQTGEGVTESRAFEVVFPEEWNVEFDIDNSDSPHSTYSQTSAKCGVCHSIHRAPTQGTSSKSTIDFGGTANTSSRYAETTYTATASTELLLKSTASGACTYCHVSSGAVKMYGGDATLALFGSASGENSWNEFYGHTTGCVSCHAAHGAKSFEGAGVSGLVLKYEGIKNLGTIPLVVQPEVYSNSPLYLDKDNMINGILQPAAIAAGVSVKDAAVTAQCSVCHASYSPSSNFLINANRLNGELFQGGSWATANGTTTPIFVGTASDPVSVLPGVSGLTYTNRAFTGSPSSLIMAYKGHPLKAADALFAGAGASTLARSTSVSEIDSYTCRSCHDAPKLEVAGYIIQSFPHYTPGYYKFMTAEDQDEFDSPANVAELNLGREGFFTSGFGTARAGRPAIMNDGYCTKCHDTVGDMY